MIILYVVLAAIAALALVVVIRTLKFKPEFETPVEVTEIPLDQDKIVEDMAAMIRCKTVSYMDSSKIDWAEFEKFQSLLAERFPRIHAACSLEKIGTTGMLYHFPGKSSKSPAICMSHYDVVPVEESGWEKPAFEGIVENGELWGRGTLDTKGTLCGAMEALEYLLGEGFVPENDLYFAFSGEEEVSGDSCPKIVEYLKEKGVEPALVLDEGGAVVEKVFPGVKKRSALIGIAEKGAVDLDFSMESQGGHASTPPKHTILGQLSKAVTNIENKPFRYQMTKPVAEMFDVMGRNSTFLFRMVFANLWLFSPVLDIWAKSSGGEINAMLRTTVAVTRMQGSKAYNVLPPSANFGINMRLLGEDTIGSAVEYLKKVIDNDKISVSVVDGSNPSRCSVTEGEGWDKLKLAIRQTWPDAIVSPYLMMAASDSRHYGAISDKVYRFSAMYLSAEQRATIHGHNERIPIETLIRAVEFYVHLLKKL
ncbi:MAG: M20 family peptidase [Oscillospiraceae bacterium]|nr:M20 family peptidase [Oscillospiraceae bacterium]